ncbi:hypothetical protein BDZ97DRAFT_1856488 [Flammula alnicola]|nr:hypothetical protein BDZ97DRAFT_1856488 [Flammula alnicola]
MHLTCTFSFQPLSSLDSFHCKVPRFLSVSSASAIASSTTQPNETAPSYVHSYTVLRIVSRHLAGLARVPLAPKYKSLAWRPEFHPV